MAAGFRRPHAPYAVPKKYFDLYDPSKMTRPEIGDQKGIPEAAWYELKNQPELSPKEYREYIAAYYACNSYVDAQAGVLLKTLDDLNLWDRTVVIFFGDHGYLTGEHGMWHKMTLFEECVRVPLIIHVPGAQGTGKIARGLVELIDLYPTLVEACGLPKPEGLEGRSLMPILNDPSKPGKSAVYAMVGRNEDRNLSHKQPTYFGKSIRTDRWRYTEWDAGKRGKELYDQSADPKEMHNLADDQKHAEVVTKMHRLLSTPESLHRR